MVAPFTGAWIEIREDQREDRDTIVAPFTGAWIEILTRKYVKPRLIVAPFTGAWIEISISIRLSMRQRSHPSRVRGLKSREEVEEVARRESHP